MPKVMISVKDTVSGVWSDPQCFPNDAAAVRAFADVVNQKDHEYNRHAADYVVYSVGVFDESEGEFIAAGPEKLVAAINLLKPEVPEG